MFITKEDINDLFSILNNAGIESLKELNGYIDYLESVKNDYESLKNELQKLNDFKNKLY